MYSKWNYVKLLMFFGFNLWYKMPELDPVMDKEDEEQWDEWHKEGTRIYMQFNIQGVCVAKDIQDAGDVKYSMVDCEFISRYRRDKELLPQWEEHIFELQYESQRHGEDWFQFNEQEDDDADDPSKDFEQAFEEGVAAGKNNASLATYDDMILNPYKNGPCQHEKACREHWFRGETAGAKHEYGIDDEPQSFDPQKEIVEEMKNSKELGGA